ncbi:3'(2'),5'-bisphosphate nucleotidase CysQ [Corynebacterium sp. ES2794-CONJ1]|uniref:3'(2'),5'-bisphosphate nucleotidase CysQ n=1 Tax=unclassified Corynebacterium TaxID=2624378 RepID=UPI002168977B|nr:MULTISPECIES: 3'(2'),5'-bisphosphate nucleotidase CysQ [unclassified Corynebacterium]MCS4490041.1 3'(2'),5'-bisphosphate nucleotidase CysQ [Corynebacterium sp. ES2775-CONJ]MCS4491597.1 3'(2'),5'-bisphosphate nucleotidase CysQ [Corynebacterium sp. ES2715-CONJ3]MCS4531701.1 3'(2'),5'-bisphosphate nucleotidase CysQ [Corynebacterium sp. ES2730-CONJ]MCU9519097.1 3'(2'),5'-bisphosphate nucleotidase CysQ [Corynebacterium sp. ES2794-CONJ1]
MTAQFDDATLTYRIAKGTGDILKGVRTDDVLRDRALGDAGDDLAQNWIARVLAQHRPHDGFLSEEAADNPERLGKERVWIIDPLDGTKEYATGRQDWAVHIALVENGIPTHAAVGLPDLGVVFHSDEARAVTGPMSKRIAISHNRPPAVAQHVTKSLGFSSVSLGSAGAKAMHVLLGDYDAYIHAGGQYEWDSAAPVGVCKAAGLHCSRLDGSELTYNNKDTYMPDILICRPELAEEIIKLATEFRDEHGSY